MIQMIPRLTRKPTGGRSRPSETLRTNACPTIRRLGVAGTKPEASSRGESPIICKRLYAVLKGRSSKAVTHAKGEERARFFAPSCSIRHLRQVHLETGLRQ